MSATGSRTESEDVRRSQLERAARKVFVESGYDRATISEITQKAGLGKGTFYVYYPSKVAIAVALRSGLMATMATAVKKAIRPGVSFAENLAALITATFEVAHKNVDLFRLTFVGADEIRPELHSESDVHAPFMAIIVKLLEDASESGEMRAMNVNVTARLVLGLLQHAVMEAFVFGDGAEAESLERGVTDIILHSVTTE